MSFVNSIELPPHLICSKSISGWTAQKVLGRPDLGLKAPTSCRLQLKNAHRMHRLKYSVVPVCSVQRIHSSVDEAHLHCSPSWTALVVEAQKHSRQLLTPSIFRYSPPYEFRTELHYSSLLLHSVTNVKFIQLFCDNAPNFILLEISNSECRSWIIGSSCKWVLKSGIIRQYINVTWYCLLGSLTTGLACKSVASSEWDYLLPIVIFLSVQCNSWHWTDIKSLECLSVCLPLSSKYLSLSITS